MAKDYSSGKYPVPSESIVLKKPTHNPFWMRRKVWVQDSVNNNLANTSGFGDIKDMIKIGGQLQTLGKIEMQKEMNLIRAACPDFYFKDTKDFILAFNQIMQGKKQTEEAIKRIKAAIEKSKKREKNATIEDKKNKRKWQDPGPHMASLFTSYFQTALTAQVNNFVKLHFTELVNNPSIFYMNWEAAYDNLINTAIDNAVGKMLTPNPTDAEKAAMYGERSEWEELAKLYNSLPDFSQEFRGMIKSKFAASLDNLKKQLFTENITNNYKRKRRKTGASTRINTILKLEERRGSIGGSVYEYIQTLADMKGTITEHFTTVVRGENVHTDMISVFNFSGKFEIGLELLNDLENTLTSSRSLEQARQQLEEFNRRNFSKLNDNFIVFTSAKLYSLGYKFPGFHNGGKQPLETLPSYIEQAGLTIANAQDFLITAYNTVDGAIYETMQGEVKSKLRLILTAAAAKLLFDDFTTIGVENIGNSSGQAIHAFALEGMYLPSSYLFIQLGEALSEAAKDYTKWFNVNVNISYTNHPYPESGPNDVVKPAIVQAWNDNISSAREKSNFSIKFLSNFKTIFSSMFN